ncbi:CDP-alcohol phosphatidyltransferase family protein [Halomicroarcula sp. GCM10025324]|uniref:CDP-alcohol phosphatidyltransferase family protein n=1 Tax=Haloarcula TaxID=2237 RepID=UPI0023E7F250|nr:CDP-alcohol phosphatidyltransferase family protein [Halomicroarcula sp. ZS-22-S1]
MSYDSTGELFAGRRLTVEGVAVAAVAVCLLAGGYRWVAEVATRAAAVRWLVPAILVVGFVSVYLWRHRGSLRRRNGTQLDSLGVANGITLARAALVAGVAGFAFVDGAGVLAWLPAVGYGTAVALDAFDGAVARSVGVETRLGERLDMAVDTTGFLVAPVVAVAWGLLPTWYLSLSAARYCYLGGCALWRRRGGTVGDLPPSRLRRPLAALQMVFITWALVPVAPTPLVRTLAPVVLLPSLAVFARDWLAVTVRTSEE